MGVLNRGAIKSEAKSFIGIDTKWLKMFAACLIYYLLDSAPNYSGIVFNLGDSDYVNYSISFGSFLPLILLPFGVAVSAYYLNHIRGFNPDWKSVYTEGFNNYGKYFVTMLLNNLFIFLWSLLLLIPGIVKAYAYSQVPFIIHDNPNLSSKDARTMSDIMTKGFKADLFVLDLSFILWYILIICTFGIAGVYVLPYVSTTKAMYYENLKKHSIDSGLISAESFGIEPIPFESEPVCDEPNEYFSQDGNGEENGEF